MELNEQIKQAPAPSAHSRQIFKNFRDATVALVDLPECPGDVRDAVTGMLDFFGDFNIAGHTTDSRRARYVLSCVFELDDEEETEAARNGAARVEDEAARAAREEAELAEDEALEAAERLADSFATIRELWDYVPAGLGNCLLSDVSTELLNVVNWENDPRAHKRVLMALLQAPERN
jgi:hypothetical protein